MSYNQICPEGRGGGVQGIAKSADENSGVAEIWLRWYGGGGDKTQDLSH